MHSLLQGSSILQAAPAFHAEHAAEAGDGIEEPVYLTSAAVETNGAAMPEPKRSETSAS